MDWKMAMAKSMMILHMDVSIKAVVGVCRGQSVFILHIDLSQKRQAERVNPAHGRVKKGSGRCV